MIKKVALALVAVIACILLYAATRPDSFTVHRSMTMKAPPDKVFALVNDLHNWGQWSPWEKLDPAMKRTHSGAASGTGAVYAWDGNSDAGAGRMEITESVPSSKIVITLDFTKPWASSNTTLFELTPKGDSTTVSWTMSGPSPYITKLMTTFVSMDKLVGGDFEKGLSAIKVIAEK